MYLSGTKDITLDSTVLGGLAGDVRYFHRARINHGKKLSLDLCRLFDVAIALAVLVFVAPLMLVIAGLIKFQDASPASMSCPSSSTS